MRETPRQFSVSGTSDRSPKTSSTGFVRLLDFSMNLLGSAINESGKAARAKAHGRHIKRRLMTQLGDVVARYGVSIRKRGTIESSCMTREGIRKAVVDS